MYLYGFTVNKLQPNNEYTELFPPNPLYSEFSALCQGPSAGLPSTMLRAGRTRLPPSYDKSTPLSTCPQRPVRTSGLPWNALVFTRRPRPIALGRSTRVAQRQPGNRPSALYETIWSPVVSLPKNNKSQPFLTYSEDWPSCPMFLPPTLAIGYDVSSDGEASVNLGRYCTTQRVKRPSWFGRQAHHIPHSPM
jgi:hypothetical protein